MSIIVPTHNRQALLLQTLHSLQQQTYPADRCELIVVDDGSVDETDIAEAAACPYPVRYLRQKHQGASLARNLGVRHSRGEILVFFDDDVWATPDTVSCLVHAVSRQEDTIAMATLLPTLPAAEVTPFAQVYGGVVPEPDGESYHENAASHDKTNLPNEGSFVPFTACMTGGLAVRRADFYALGMFHDPTPGLWPNWDDIDFAYRAHRQGFRFWRSATARVYHYDQALRTLTSWCDRLRRAGVSAAWLFQRYPDLAQHLPMFADKQPIAMRQDHSGLVLRKLLRRIVSTSLVVYLLTALAELLAARRPYSPGLPLLYRWIVSAHIYQGFQIGRAQVAQATAAVVKPHVLL